MARRQQRRRPAFKPPRGASRDDSGEQAAIEAGARRLLNLNDHDQRSLRTLIVDLQTQLDEANKASYDDPSPEALQRFRRATREVAEGERALELMGPEAAA